jgi:hypothetical protein
MTKELILPILAGSTEVLVLLTFVIRLATVAAH